MNETFQNITVTNVFKRNFDANDSIIVNEGGARSSKTYSIAQLFIYKALAHYLKKDPVRFSIVGKTLPSLKATAMRDFFDILRSNNLYTVANHNRTENTYTLFGNEIEFFSADQEQKLRGRQRAYCWMSEANGFLLNDFIQLNLRTNIQMFMDYNPSDQFHWIYDEVIPRANCKLIKSSYLDNPFVNKRQKAEIEALKELNPELWKVYGLGERAGFSDTVYPNWSIGETDEQATTIYGLDFGYNNPTALVEIKWTDTGLFVRELLYETKLTNSDLIERLKSLIPDKSAYIYADCAEPNRIEEIRRAGFYHLFPADKSVKDGIDYVNQQNVFVEKNSLNVQKENRAYSFKKDRAGNNLDEPVKFNDHAMDAIRYAIYTHGKKFMNIKKLIFSRSNKSKRINNKFRMT